MRIEKRYKLKEQNLYIIAGCNGVGKTTASFTVLPEILNCKEFINADEIAKGLSPFQPEKVAIEAGRIMLHRIDELLESRESFAFETTLATKSYKKKILEAQSNNYNVTLLFFWLNSVELANERVKERVREGGHNIPENIIYRRYYNGINNLFTIYLPIVNEAFLFDNSEGKHIAIAQKTKGNSFDIINVEKFTQLQEIYEKKGI